MTNQIDTENLHQAVVELLHIQEMIPLDNLTLQKFMKKVEKYTNEKLHITVNEINFENPLLVAAGWDKPGRAVKALYDMGFAGVEVGTVLSRFQTGNPRPRHFMMSASVSLNRYGFNNPGMEVIADNLERYKEMNIPTGISLGKNKELTDGEAPQAYAEVAKRMQEFASYFAINVSSPNTPGLRKLQDKEPLNNIVKAVKQSAANIPVFVKIAPDMTDEAVLDVIDVVTSNGLAGIIATNTTVNGELKAKYGENWRNEMGGLAGDDEEFRKMSTDKIRFIYKETQGKITIIGAGGIKDTKTALEKIKAGASLLQIMTALDIEGPELPNKINKGIVEYMDKNGVKNVSELVGKE